MRLSVVGLGPGRQEQMTLQAEQTLRQSDLIVGYTVYVDLIKPFFPQKEFLSTPMRGETDRCRKAIEQCITGKNVAVVCSGDAGVYGMAGLIYQLSEEYPPFEIEVVPGITAACSGAAVLGAPLVHDFAVISLSDLLTPWELIEKRLSAAAEADFVICLYNPASRKRADYLQKACELILQYRSEKTVCGFVKNIGREGEQSKLLSLGCLKDTQVDMFTTVYIGNSQTMAMGDKMVTPRGYSLNGRETL